MSIQSIWFDDMVVVPQGKDLGGGLPLVSLRESSFHADEGWDIRETLPGVFSLLREGMTSPVVVGGYGYSFVRSRDHEVRVETFETLPGMVDTTTFTRKGKR